MFVIRWEMTFKVVCNFETVDDSHARSADQLDRISSALNAVCAYSYHLACSRARVLASWCAR